MSGVSKLPGWALFLLRRVLFFWVRTVVFPERPADLALDPAKPVCYVLQRQHLSNVLVLAESTRRAGLPPADLPLRGFERAVPVLPASLVFLQRQAGFSASARERRAPSPQIAELLAASFGNPALDIQIVPVVILWGRRPDKEESILKALFSETWREPGPIRQFFNILLHGRNVLVRFNAPISLGALAREGLDEAQALRKLLRVLRVHFRRQREMAIGPDLSHRNTQVEAIVESDPVRRAIADEAQTRAVSHDQAQARARRFALEIASDYSYGTVRAFGLFLSWLWTRLYDAIDIHGLEVLSRIAPGQSVVYVPTHRSHIDYLVLSHQLYDKGFMAPHIAAGANLNMPWVGTLLRRSGAFFLRRSFKGEPLYAAVFHEYLHRMIVRGFALEYFIEGGRSRSGRTLSPRAGILGMTVRSFIREHARPLVFVPVYIGYEKLIEGRTYLRELAGRPKQKESLWALMKSVRAIRREFGTVHINFGEPMDLSAFLEAQRPGWREETSANNEAPEWSREVIAKAALELARRLNDAVVVNPVNLMALTLLATPRRTIDAALLDRLLAHYQALCLEAPYSPSTVPCRLDARQIVAHVERLGFIERVDHPLGELIRVPEDKAALLAYFRNNVLHLFALPALIACLIDHNRQLPRQRLLEAAAGIYSLMGAELFMRWRADELPGAMQILIEAMAARGLLRVRPDDTLAAPDPNSQALAELRLIGETVRPVLERHFLTLSLLQHGGSGTRTRQELENDGYLLSQRLALLHDFNASEQAEKASFAALVTQLIDTGVLREDDAARLHFDPRIAIPLEHAELVLPEDARRIIERMALQRTEDGGLRAAGG